MNDRRLKILRWPEQLNRALGHLERTTHQDFIETRMDSGHVRRSPKTTPIPIFKGIVSLSRDERVPLDEFFSVASAGRHFSFQDPSTGEKVYAAFMQAPFDREIRSIVGGDTTYLVEITLKDTTTLVKAALKHGAVSHA